MGLLIIDGICTAGKSLLLEQLQQHVLSYRPHFSKLVLSEHLTERHLEDSEISGPYVEQHVARILNIAGELQAIKATGPFVANENVLTMVVERLFLTLMSRGLVDLRFFERNSEKWEHLAVKNLLLVVPTSQLHRRLTSSLSHRNQGWRDYIDQLGGIDAAVQRFDEQQRRMLEQSILISGYIKTEVIEVKDIEQPFSNAQLDGILQL